MLGRLDEQIKHVNSGQKELGERIDKRYLDNDSNDDESKSLENEELIAEVQLKWQESLNQILNAATIAPDEKLRLEQQLKEKESELTLLRGEQAEIEAARIVKLKSYLTRKVEHFGLEEAATYSPDELLYILHKKSMPAVRRDLLQYGYIESEKMSNPSEVTAKGQAFISTIVAGMLKCES